MSIDKAIEELQNVIKSKKDQGYSVDHYKQYNNCELLYAALALMGTAYSQLKGLNTEQEANEMWPFGVFEPSENPNDNLIKACYFILSEVEKNKSQ
jgi:hypothetical protein